MSDETINEAVRKALEGAIPGAVVTPDPPKQPEPTLVPPYVAANICKLLERVQVTGLEALAWTEAFQLMQKIGAPVLMQQQGPGVPFQGLGR